MNQPEKEYGWITALTPAEVGTLGARQKTDEEFLDNEWSNNWFCWCEDCINDPHLSGRKVRRRINPGEGFEIVNKDGNIQRGDSMTYNGFTWVTICDGAWWNKPVEDLVRASQRDPQPILAIRRKTQPAASPQPSPWIKFSERRPTEKEYPIEAFDSEPPVDIRRFNYFEGTGEFHRDFTHWRKADNTFPEPEKSASEKAYIQWGLNGNRGTIETGDPLTIWNAAWLAAIAFSEGKK